MIELVKVKEHGIRENVKATPKQYAKEMLMQAIEGYIENWDPRDTGEHMTDRELDQVSRAMCRQSERIEKFLFNL